MIDQTATEAKKPEVSESKQCPHCRDEFFKTRRQSKKRWEVQESCGKMPCRIKSRKRRVDASEKVDTKRANSMIDHYLTKHPASGVNSGGLHRKAGV